MFQSKRRSSVSSGSPSRSRNSMSFQLWAVERRAQADDSVVALHQLRGVSIAVRCCAPGAEDACGVPGFDPFGGCWRGGSGGDGDARDLEFGGEMEGQDRQGVEGVFCEEDGARPVRVPRHPEAAGRACGAGVSGLAPCARIERFGADGFAGGVPADEHGVSEAVGVEQPEVAAQRDERGRDAEAGDEAALDAGPEAVGAQRLGVLPDAARQAGEDGEGLVHRASAFMDHQVDGAASGVSAAMVVEHEAVDADGRAPPPPARGVVGIAAVAEGAEGVFEGTGAQGLGLHPPVPGVEEVHV